MAEEELRNGAQHSNQQEPSVNISPNVSSPSVSSDNKTIDKRSLDDPFGFREGPREDSKSNQTQRKNSVENGDKENIGLQGLQDERSFVSAADKTVFDEGSNTSNSGVQKLETTERSIKATKTYGNLATLGTPSPPKDRSSSTSPTYPNLSVFSSSLSSVEYPKTSRHSSVSLQSSRERLYPDLKSMDDHREVFGPCDDPVVGTQPICSSKILPDAISLMQGISKTESDTVSNKTTLISSVSRDSVKKTDANVKAATADVVDGSMKNNSSASIELGKTPENTVKNKAASVSPWEEVRICGEVIRSEPEDGKKVIFIVGDDESRSNSTSPAGERYPPIRASPSPPPDFLRMKQTRNVARAFCKEDLMRDSLFGVCRSGSERRVRREHMLCHKRTSSDPTAKRIPLHSYTHDIPPAKPLPTTQNNVNPSSSTMVSEPTPSSTVEAVPTISSTVVAVPTLSSTVVAVPTSSSTVVADTTVASSVVKVPSSLRSDMLDRVSFSSSAAIQTDSPSVAVVESAGTSPLNSVPSSTVSCSLTTINSSTTPTVPISLTSSMASCVYKSSSCGASNSLESTVTTTVMNSSSTNLLKSSTNLALLPSPVTSNIADTHTPVTSSTTLTRSTAGRTVEPLPCTTGSTTVTSICSLASDPDKVSATFPTGLQVTTVPFSGKKNTETEISLSKSPSRVTCRSSPLDANPKTKLTKVSPARDGDVTMEDTADDTGYFVIDEPPLEVSAGRRVTGVAESTMAGVLDRYSPVFVLQAVLNTDALNFNSSARSRLDCLSFNSEMSVTF